MGVELGVGIALGRVRIATNHTYRWDPAGLYLAPKRPDHPRSATPGKRED